MELSSIINASPSLETIFILSDTNTNTQKIEQDKVNSIAQDDCPIDFHPRAKKKSSAAFLGRQSMIYSAKEKGHLV